MAKKIFIINGPNLNQLGTRQPEIYGSETLADIEAMCEAKATELGLEVSCFQSNHEGELVDVIHKAKDEAAGVIINAGAYTHTSVALHDALLLLEVPLIELHISNVYKREPFRHHSYISPVATAVICGLGVKGYSIALEAIAELV